MRTAEWDGTPERPDGWPGVVPVSDTDRDADGDGTADTVVVAREAGGAWVFTDLDGDGFADQVLDVTPDEPDDPGDPEDGDDGDGNDGDVLDAVVRLVTGRTP